MLWFTVAVHAAAIIMTEDMIGVMMIGTITADHTGKLWKSLFTKKPEFLQVRNSCDLRLMHLILYVVGCLLHSKI